MELNTIGSRLREMRESRKLLQKEVGNALGISDRSIGNYEANDRKPDPEMLKKLAEFYGVSIDFLVYGFERTRIANLMEAARCGRTFEQFSEDVGIGAEYLGRLCKGELSEPPSPETIKKIMSHPDSQLLSDYYELMEAAGHMDHQTALELKLEEMKKTAAKNMTKEQIFAIDNIVGLQPTKGEFITALAKFLKQTGKDPDNTIDFSNIPEEKVKLVESIIEQLVKIIQ